MKKVLVLIGTGAIVAFGALLVALLLRPRAPLTGDQGNVTCPIYFSSDAAKLLPEELAGGRWQIYSFDAGTGTAHVKVAPSTISTSARSHSCELTLLRAPETPGKGADWRMGRRLSPERFIGKNVRFRVAIKADRNVGLDTSQIYITDGQKVMGAGISQLTPEWRVFEASMVLGPDAIALEVWMRLLLDRGTVVPGSAKIYLVPEVEVQ